VEYIVITRVIIMDKTKPKLKTKVIMMIMTLFQKDTILRTYTYMITQGNLPIRTSSKRKSHNKDKTNKISMSWRS